MAEFKSISCFSYKGGAGRSTLAINVVPYIAQKLNATEEKPLVLVDMDVDSCGLTYLFNLHKVDKTKQFSVQSLFHTKFGSIPEEDDPDVTAIDHALFKNLAPVGQFFGMRPRSIICLPANPGDTLGSSESNYDTSDKGLVNEFVLACRNYCCGVLFDSAVGDQLTAQWSNKYSKYIMCCMRPTKQFREGTNRFFDKFDSKVANKNVIIIPNVVPTDNLSLEDENGQVNFYPDYAKEQIINDFEDNQKNGNNNYYLNLLKGNKFGVPKIDRFMWQEGVLKCCKDLTDLEHVALDRYDEIASIICND